MKELKRCAICPNWIPKRKYESWARYQKKVTCSNECRIEYMRPRRVPFNFRQHH